MPPIQLPTTTSRPFSLLCFTPPPHTTAGEALPPGPASRALHQKHETLHLLAQILELVFEPPRGRTNGSGGTIIEGKENGESRLMCPV